MDEPADWAGGPGYYPDAGGGMLDGGTTPAPETEERRDFNAPQGGSRFVFVANPVRDSVAVIDSTTLAIRSVEAGDGPSALAVVEGQDIAIVVNLGSSDITRIEASEDEIQTETVSVVDGANAVAVAPDGRHAVVYFDSAADDAGLGAGSFQEVSVVHLEDASQVVVNLSVGFRPIEVVFTADSSKALVITEDGISVLALDAIIAPTFAPPIGLGDDASGALSRDVSVSPDGAYALARREGENTVRLVDLSTAAILELDAGSPVTDLDIAPSGEFALTVLRDTSTVLRIPVPDGFVQADLVERFEFVDAPIGSVAIAPDGSAAVLYTTVGDEEQATLLDLTADGAARAIRLRKSVRAVAISPDGATALLIHDPQAGNPTEPGIDLEEQIDRSYGYTVVDLESGFAKLQLTDADVGPAIIVPDATHAFLSLRDDAAGFYDLQRLALDSLVVDDFRLGSPPLSVGVVSGTEKVFVGQEHPEGRITFVQWASGATESVTGFELNSRIVE